MLLEDVTFNWVYRGKLTAEQCRIAELIGMSWVHHVYTTYYEGKARAYERDHDGLPTLYHSKTWGVDCSINGTVRAWLDDFAYWQGIATFNEITNVQKTGWTLDDVETLLYYMNHDEFLDQVEISTGHRRAYFK